MQSREWVRACDIEVKAHLSDVARSGAIGIANLAIANLAEYSGSSFVVIYHVRRHVIRALAVLL
jgi:hypothetical protein